MVPKGISSRAVIGITPKLFHPYAQNYTQKFRTSLSVSDTVVNTAPVWDQAKGQLKRTYVAQGNTVRPNHFTTLVEVDNNLNSDMSACSR